MRRALLVAAPGAAFVLAYALNAWYADALRSAQATFNTGSMMWVGTVLQLVTMLLALLLGWLILEWSRPDPLVSTVYVVVGLAIAFSFTIQSSLGLSFPDWTTTLVAGLSLPLWLAAAVTVVGLAGVGRSLGSRRTGA